MNGEREDVLLGRIVGGEAGEEAWRELEEIASLDPGAWARLAQALRVENLVAAALAPELAKADSVRLSAPRRLPRRIRVAAAAGLLACAAFAAGFGLAPRGPGGVPASAPRGFDAAFARCLEEGLASGRLLQELPPVILDQRPADDGKGVVVVGLRRLVERRLVERLYEIRSDETGAAVAAPLDVASLRPQRSF